MTLGLPAPTVSVVMPTYNGAGLILSLIHI